MLREKCKTCGSSDLYQGRMVAQGGVVVGRKFRNWGWTSLAQCAVCTTCGGIEPYLDDAGIAKVREWKAAESHEITGTTGDNPARPLNLGVALMILAAIAGIAAAVIIPWLQVAQKLK